LIKKKSRRELSQRIFALGRDKDLSALLYVEAMQILRFKPDDDIYTKHRISKFEFYSCFDISFTVLSQYILSSISCDRSVGLKTPLVGRRVAPHFTSLT
jgi:hypothetical protein